MVRDSMIEAYGECVKLKLFNPERRLQWCHLNASLRKKLFLVLLKLWVFHLNFDIEVSPGCIMVTTCRHSFALEAHFEPGWVPTGIRNKPPRWLGHLFLHENGIGKRQLFFYTSNVCLRFQTFCVVQK